MNIGKTARQSQFHRSQIGRAQRYIRMHLDEAFSIAQLAREAGSSPFHFARLFQAFVGETPFEFIRRIRLMTALQMLREDAEASVTEIALCIGYETPAAFNKALRKAIRMTPSDFRKAGQAKQDALIQALSEPKRLKEVYLQMTTEYDAIHRDLTHYVFLEQHGPFAEIAPPLWGDLMPMLPPLRSLICEFLGLSGVDPAESGEKTMIYQAGVALSEKPAELPAKMQYRAVPAGRYARFLLTGPYTQIWSAFDQIFKTLAERGVALRPECCIENYLNDPQNTPEKDLKTELLVPIA